MKKLLFPFVCFLCLLTISGCKDNAKVRLMVNEANKLCPFDVNGIGKAKSITYEDGLIVYHLAVDQGTDNPVDIDQLLSEEVVIMNIYRQNEDLKKVLVDEGVGLCYRYYDSSNNLLQSFEIPNKKIKEILLKIENGTLSNERLMEIYNQQTKLKLPLTVDKGVVFTQVNVEDGMEVYTYELQEGECDIALVRSNAKELQEHPELMLNMSDPDVEALVSLLYDLKMGLEYRYIIPDTDEHIVVHYSREQLRNLYAGSLLNKAVN